MTTVTRFVGLDYHQDSVQVCVLDAGGMRLVNRSVENQWKAIADVVWNSMDENTDVLASEACDLC